MILLVTGQTGMHRSSGIHQADRALWRSTVQILAVGVAQRSRRFETQEGGVEADFRSEDVGGIDFVVIVAVAVAGAATE